jgi:hypothetical protein
MIRHSVTLELGEFARETLENGARSYALSPEELVGYAVRYYLGDRRSGRSTYPVPSSFVPPHDAPLERIGLDLELDAGTWRRLDSECRRQDVACEQLVAHAVLYLIADLDSGRAAHRLVNGGADAR